MAKGNEEYFNDSIIEHLSSIDDDRLARIADAVAKFTNNYKEYVKSQQQAEKKNKIVKELKVSEKSRKADAVKSENYLKHIAENSNVQSKTLTKILEESIDSKTAQETLQKIQEKALLSNRAMNQDIIKGLSELTSNTSENVKYSEKLNNITAEMQRENAQARLQSMIKDSKRFRLESNYWKSLTGNIKSIASEFHDFKNNPSAWMAEAMGDMLGKSLDKSIDGLKSTLDAGIKSISQGLNGLKDSIFDMMADQKKRAESLAQEFNRSYIETSGALKKSNTAVAMLAQRGDLDISRTSKNVDVITSKLLRRYGDDLKNMSQDLYNKHFMSYAQLINSGAADKIDEIEEIAAGNEELMEEMIKTETQLAGIRSRQDLRIQKGMDAAIYTAEEAHKLGMTYEQSIRANERNQIFIAKVLASNSQLGTEEIRAFTSLQKALMSQDFVSNILDDKNVNLSQLIGIDSNQAKKILTSGSDKERLDFMNKIIQSGAYNEIPALKRMMEDLGFDAQSLNVLSKQGGLKIDDASIKKITDAQNQDFTKINDVLLSSGSKINEEIRARISMLSSEGIRNKDKSLTETGKIQVEALKEFNTLEKIIREEDLDTKDQRQHAKELYDLIKEYSSGNQDAINKFINLSDKDRALAEKIAYAYNKSEKLVEDQIQISETLSEAQDLGLDKALSGGGLQGLFSGLLDVGLKSAYSPEYQDKLSSFMDNIKRSIEPAVNVFKELLIDPIIDSLQDIVGKLLGEILVSVKGIYRNITKSEYTEEEKQLDRTKFLKTTNVSADIEDIKRGDKAKGRYSDDYIKAISNIDNLTMEDVDKYNLSSKESAGLKNYIAQNSSAMNTNKRILGATTVGELDLSEQRTSDTLNNMLSGITLKYNAENKSATASGAETITEVLKQSSGFIFGDDPSKMIDVLAKDKSIDKDLLKSTYEVLKEQVNVIYSNKILDLFGIGEMGLKNGGILRVLYNSKYADAKNILAAYLLLKSNLDLYGNSWGGIMSYSLIPHDGRAKRHFILNPTFGEDQYYANGGVIAATKGGQRVTVGEAGHDEIIIPTDPAKQSRAQELLKLAQNKYGLYASDPENQELKNQMAELLFDLRVLMIQLDPMRDIIAMQNVMSAFGLLKNITSVANPDSSSLQPEELIGGSVPVLGTPIKNAANLSAIRYAIIEEAKKYIGTRYAEAPAGLVCNQLVNAAYAGVLGKSNYAEMLRTLGYAHDEMHTISGFIPEIRKGSNDKVMLASGVEYSSLSNLAKPGDLVFSANTGKNPSPLNPDNHGHVNLFIDKDSKIDSTSVKINGKDGVGIHKPYKGHHMLMNLLDNMPESWYQSKGLLKDAGIEDSSSLTSHYIYDPSLQDTPNASYVSDQVSRANKAKEEKERRRIERQERYYNQETKELRKTLGNKFVQNNTPKNYNFISQEPFRTSGMSSSSVSSYEVAR